MKAQRVDRFGFWLAVVVLAAGWGLLFQRLQVDWSVNPQYGYGWFVPLLGPLLLWGRWPTRPRPESVGHWMSLFGVLAILGLLSLQLPIRLVQEANPEWRMVLWLHGLQLVGVSLLGLYLVGGRGWVWHFGFPFLFMLIAIPWPMGLERSMIQGLMRGVAAAVVEILGMFGIPAFQHGNVIEVTTGVVGVDEACSGVRSLQTSLLIALFLGDHFRFGAVRRVFLVVGGLGVALLANVGRTLLLTWVAAERGLEGMERLHDPAGIGVLITVLLALWVLTMGLRRCAKVEDGTRAQDEWWPSSIPRKALAGLLGWLIVVEVGTEWWYWRNEREMAETREWSLEWPEGAPAYEVMEIPEKAQAMLRYTQGEGASWDSAAGHRWQAFYFWYAPGRNSAQLATGHTPEICMGAVGLNQGEAQEIRGCTVNGIRLPFRQYLFERKGRVMHVFYCHWEERLRIEESEAGDEPDYRSREGRMAAVWAGRRHLGQKVLEVAITGPETPEEAWEELQRGLGELVRSEAEGARQEVVGGHSTVGNEGRP